MPRTTVISNTGSAANSSPTAANSSPPSPPSRSTYRQGGSANRRAYSWRGELPPYDPTIHNDKSTNNPSYFRDVLILEARAAISWAAGASLWRLILQLMIQLASISYPSYEHTVISSAWIHRFLVIPSVISQCLLWFMPRKVLTSDAPGFIYASAWLLLGIKGQIGKIPHTPSRICEAVLGRISPVECITAIAIHYVGAVTTLVVLHYCLISKYLAEVTFAPIEYSSSASGDGNLWFVDFCHELVVTALFTVALHVFPVILSINRSPQLLTLVFLYPFYIYSVDSAGRASTLAPSILVSLSAVNRFTNLPVLYHVFGRGLAQTLSGFVAGKIVQGYFPDDPKS